MTEFIDQIVDKLVFKQELLLVLNGVISFFLPTSWLYSVVWTHFQEGSENTVVPR